MKVTLLFALLAGPVYVLAASMKYAAVAKSYIKASKAPAPGNNYVFQNYASKSYVAYDRKSYQSIYLDKKKYSKMTLARHGTFMKVTPTDSNDKCISAQWGFPELVGKVAGGKNWAMVLYACSKKDKHTIAKRDLDITPAAEVHALSKRFKYPPMGALRPDKQLIIVKKGSKKGTFYFIPSDHIYDQKTMAMSNCVIRQTQQRKSRGICLKFFNKSDKNQLWTIKRANKSKKRGLEHTEELVDVSHEEIFGSSDIDEISMNPRDLFEDLDLDTREFEAYRD